MKVTKNQIRKMVKESVSKHRAKSSVVKESAAKKSVKITVKELNERVRTIVQQKLSEMKAPANNVPSLSSMKEGFGVSTDAPVVKEALVLTDKEQTVLSYASLLAKSGGSIGSPRALQESITALKAVKPVTTLSDDELEVVGPVIKEWAIKQDDSISEAAKALAERLSTQQ